MLEISNVYKSFKVDNNPNNDRQALNGVSLIVEDNDFVTIIGGNGSGKSTLFNVIAGSVFPNGGEIYIDERNVTTVQEYLRAAYIGRVFQDPMIGTIPTMTLFENLALADNRGKSASLKWALTGHKKERFIELLRPLSLNLETRLNSRVGVFSGGERQAITLLMATMNQPRILLLDEHTAALDPKIAKVIMDLTEKIVNELHVPTIMITHNMKDAIKYGNKLVMMSEGKIIFEASENEKKELTVEGLIKKFAQLSSEILPDDILLSK